ncbi:hypothetical protein ABKA04_009815 [Annulohypoxylon sp. FPYF3050]
MADPQPDATLQPSLPDYMKDPNAVLGDSNAEWRNTRPPDYSKTRNFYSGTKRCKHEAGSLSELVENLVKNWEIEASFKTRLADWRTIDHETFTFAINNLEPYSAEHMLRVGTYNAIISPCEYYDPRQSDFAASHKTFKRMMPSFAWEVLEVHSGPPVVSFKWRHWAEHTSIDPTIIEALEKSMFQVTELKTWFDSNEMFKQIDPNGVVTKKG